MESLRQIKAEDVAARLVDMVMAKAACPNEKQRASY